MRPTNSLIRLKPSSYKSLKDKAEKKNLKNKLKISNPKFQSWFLTSSHLPSLPSVGYFNFSRFKLLAPLSFLQYMLKNLVSMLSGVFNK